MLVHLLRLCDPEVKNLVLAFCVSTSARCTSPVCCSMTECAPELLLVGAEPAGGCREFLVGRGRGAGSECVAADLACGARRRFRQREQRRRHRPEHGRRLEHLDGRVLEPADDRGDAEIQVGELRCAGRDGRADAAQRRAGRHDGAGQRRASALCNRHRCRGAADLATQRLGGSSWRHRTRRWRWPRARACCRSRHRRAWRPPRPHRAAGRA